MHNPLNWSVPLNRILGKASGAVAAMRRPLECGSPTPSALRPVVAGRFAARRWRLFWLLAALTAQGCGAEPKVATVSVADPPSIRLIQPATRKIIRVVRQPSFIESFERTSIFPKLTAYIQEWKVDIGDKVKKDDVLATLFIPELVEDHGTKKADVTLALVQIDLAEKLVKVAHADLESARAHLEEAEAILEKYQADVARWDSEVERLKHEVERGVVDPQILLESTNQLRATKAARDSAKATIMKAKADVLSRAATLEKANVDVGVARARLAVSESEEKRIKAWVGYIKLVAPYDGVVVVRNANTGDFVMPAAGDPTAMARTPNISPNGAAPIYVIDRLDKVRIFIDVPESDANYIHNGTRASVLVKAYREQPISGSVTRSAWALNVKSRTLRVEVDLPNPEGQILPGMYAIGKVIIERPGVRAIPTAALSYSGDQTFCWVYRDGKAVRTAIQTGVSDGEWIEVASFQLPESPKGEDVFKPFDGTEQVILGDLTVLVDGSPVRVIPATDETKVAGSSPTPVPTPSAAPATGGSASGPREASITPVRAAGTKF